MKHFNWSWVEGESGFLTVKLVAVQTPLGSSELQLFSLWDSLDILLPIKTPTGVQNSVPRYPVMSSIGFQVVKLFGGVCCTRFKIVQLQKEIWILRSYFTAWKAIISLIYNHYLHYQGLIGKGIARSSINFWIIMSQQGAPKLEVDAAGLDSFHAWYRKLPEVTDTVVCLNYHSLRFQVTDQFQINLNFVAFSGYTNRPFLRPQDVLLRPWWTCIHGSSSSLP